MSIDQLIAKKGDPINKKDNTIDPSYEMYEYANDERYQVIDNQVISQFKKPNSNESNIQYWRHKLSDKSYKIIAADNSDNNKDSHTNGNKLICDECGLTVLFNDRGIVKRVIRYAERLETAGTYE